MNTTNSNSPVRILITGAAGNIGYSLAFMIGQGNMFGKNQEIILHLFDLPFMEDALKGVKMELNDCSFNILKEVVTTSDPSIAFKDIDYAVLCGAFPRKEGMERKDLLEKLAASPAVCSHGSCKIIPEKSRMYRFAKNRAFFGLGAYG